MFKKCINNTSQLSCQHRLIKWHKDSMSLSTKTFAQVITLYSNFFFLSTTYIRYQ